MSTWQESAQEWITRRQLWDGKEREVGSRAPGGTQPPRPWPQERIMQEGEPVTPWQQLKVKSTWVCALGPLENGQCNSIFHHQSAAKSNSPRGPRCLHHRWRGPKQPHLTGACSTGPEGQPQGTCPHTQVRGTWPRLSTTALSRETGE